jgi:hypothetical protein
METKMDATSGEHEANPQLASAQKLLDEARKQLEASFRIYPVVGNTTFAPTGELYREIVSGIRDTFHDTAEAAVVAWQKKADIYATRFGPIEGKAPYTLYWRIEPEIDRSQGRWKVYSRFLVSNKPVKFAARRSIKETSFCFPAVRKG